MIFINDNVPSHVTMRGTARYVRKITEGITRHFGDKVVIYSSDRQDYGEAKYIQAIRFRGIRRIGLHDVLASLVAFREQPKVFFSTFFGKARTKAAEVFTVYDMSIEMSTRHTPSTRRDVRRDIKDKRQCLERASALLSISESTAKDITFLYPHIDASKIFVTPLGVDTLFFEENEGKNDKKERSYFLYVGYREGHKNFIKLLNAFGQSGLAGEFDLHVISPGTFHRYEVECINNYQLQTSVRLIPYVNELELRSSYAGAVAFVYPSTLEGFGLPILEAMASGTLVATSNVTSMPEVGGNVANYFDPYDEESIMDCLRKVAYLPIEERNQRIAQGIARARAYTWERCQQQTVEVLEKLLG